MLPALTLVAFVVLVLVIAWRTRNSAPVLTTCCAKHPWPPHDLVDPPRQR